MATELDEVLTLTRVSADQGQVHVHTNRCFRCHNPALSLSTDRPALSQSLVLKLYEPLQHQQAHRPWSQTTSSSVDVILLCSSGV